jgi:putative SbcD/Mre11-related phosphoesterase
MEILDGIIADDLFLYLKEYRTLILSDVHIGYEESLNNRGILIPRKNFDDLTVRLERSLNSILKGHKIEHIIINGDLVHEFSKVPSKVKDSVRRFVKFLKQYGDIKIIIGNHDKALRFILEEDMLVERIALGDILIIHGDKIPSKDSLKDIKTLIIGHEHPAVSIKSGNRSEKFKCFLKGRYSKRNLIVMPSCNILIEGTDVSSDSLLSPLLNDVDLGKFNVYVIEDKVYDFGKLKAIPR